MASTYVNDLRIEEQATGENSGTWGTKVNSAFSQIAEAFSYGTKQLAADSNETFTMPDGTSDGTRSLYLKITSAGSLTATRTVTLGPNTVSKLWIIENATTGSQSITIAQGSGGTVTIPTGAVKMVYSDGAGSGAAVVDALVGLHLSGSTNLASLNVDGTVTADGLTVDTTTLVVDATNNRVGIGTTSPQRPLHLSIGTDNTGARFESSDTEVALEFIDSAGTAYFRASGGYIKMGATASDSLTILSSGNVGIGTTSPSTALTVSGAFNATSAGSKPSITGTGNYGGGIGFVDTNVSGMYTDTSGANLKFFTNQSGSDAAQSNVRLTIDGSGNVGIGVTPEAWNTYSTLQIGNGAIANYSPTHDMRMVSNAYYTSGWKYAESDAATMYLQDGDNGEHIFYTAAAGTADAAISWDERMRIDSSGRLLINKTSATGNLSLESQAPTGFSVGSGFYSASTQSTIEFQDSNTTADYKVRIGSETDDMLMFAGGSERLRIDASGNVGIGVTPQNSSGTWRNFQQGGMNLVARSAGGVDGMIGTNYVFKTDNSEVYKYTAGTSRLFFDANEIRFQQAASGTAGTAISWSEAMRIDSSGNVIAGGTSAQASDAVTLMSDGEVTAAGFYFSNNIGSAMNDTGIRRATTSTMVFDTGSTERMRIDSGGNVGIGTTSPQKTLHVNSGTANIGLRVESTDATASIEFMDSGTTSTGTSARVGGISNDFFVQTNAAERMRIDSSGNLLVGDSSSVAAGSEAVEIRGDAGYIKTGRNNTGTVGHILFYNPNGNVGSITTSGSSTAYNTSSDQRLKDNIVDAPSASDDIDAIRVRSFDWKVDGSHQKYGMVAQELVTVAPEAVTQPEDSEEMMSVDYSKLVPMMLKEIQQLRARVAQLEGAN